MPASTIDPSPAAATEADARSSAPPTKPNPLVRLWRSYAFQRILKSIITVFLVATFTFALVRWMPGDPLQAEINRLVRDQGLSRTEAAAAAASLFAYNPDAPLIQQYVDYLGNLLQGDLGQSIVSPGTDVSTHLMKFLPWTLFSVGTGLVISFIVGVILGVLAAYWRGSWFDHLITNLSSAIGAVPNYVWAMGLIVVGGVQLQLFDFRAMRGTLSPGVQPGFNAEFFSDALYHASLPITVYVLTSVGGWALQMKSSTTQVLDEDFVTVAHARGLSPNRIRTQYVARNALIPLFTQFAVALGFVVGGSTLVEQIFKYDGVGYYFFNAIQTRDYPVIQGFVLMITISVVVANLLADLVLSRLDPRIRVEGAQG